MVSRAAKLLLTSATLLAAVAHAGATLDASFGEGGTTTVPFRVRSILEDARGRVLLTGQATSYGSVHATSIAAARLLPSGVPDPGFVYGGYPASPGHVQDAVGGWGLLQPDGRIVLTGQRNESGGFSGTVARFEDSGQVDRTFLAEGLNAPVGSGRGAVVQSNGAIVIAAGSSLVRFGADGSIDPAYGSGGFAQLPIHRYPGDIVQRLVRLHDDRALVLVNPNVCSTGIPASCPPAQLIQLTAEGQLDTTFNGTGQATFPGVLGGDIAVRADGRLVIAWNRLTFPASARLQRLMPDGSADMTFGHGGIVDLAHSGEAIAGIVLETDGGILALGQSTGYEGKRWFALLRWTSEGAPEGRVVPIRRPQLAPSSLLAQADGKRVVAALYESKLGTTTTYDSTVMRYGSGTLDIAADSQLFVAQQYRDFLRREGDAEGIGFWSRYRIAGHDACSGRGRVHRFARVRPGSRSRDRPALPRPAVALARLRGIRVLERTLTRAEVLLAFAGSAEFRAGSDTEVLVASAYAAFLQRAPDPAGFRYWLDHLDGGGSRLDLIQAFIESREYRDRFMP